MDPVSELAERIRNALARASAASAGPLLVACSGGVDSTALALATARVGKTGLAHVDHGLHHEHARAARFVAELARALGAGYALAELQLGERERGEATMRDKRYAALIAIARAHGARVVLTAH